MRGNPIKYSKKSDAHQLLKVKLLHEYRVPISFTFKEKEVGRLYTVTQVSATASDPTSCLLLSLFLLQRLVKYTGGGARTLVLENQPYH